MTTTGTVQVTGLATTVFTALTQAPRLIVKLFVARRNRQAIMNLGEWNDYMLHDIGITRADLHAAVGQSPLHDPSAELGAIAEARVKHLKGRSIRRA